jgi:hypothetical protein
MRIGYSLAVAVLLSALHTLPQAAEGEARPAHGRKIEDSLSSVIRGETRIAAESANQIFFRSFYPQLVFAVSASPIPRFGSENAVEGAALAFVVSVCLDDFEYSIACRERSSLEAAKRLEQIYLDDYAAGRAAGTLIVWFAVAAERGEQVHFLREVEDRAIESAARKLKDDVDHLTASAENSQETPGDAEGAIQQITQQVQRWHDDASMEARNGTNWSHDWESRTHSYKPGPALYELVRISDHSRAGN